MHRFTIVLRRVAFIGAILFNGFNFLPHCVTPQKLGCALIPRLLLTVCLGFFNFSYLCFGAESSRPNILWIIVDDMSANFGCYGEKTISTPNVDKLAAEGTRFSRAYITAPVCSPCRSAMITGMYQTSISAHHHRSGRGTEKIHLPKQVEPVPVLFQRAGYFTAISGWPIPANQAVRGKTDYNFEWDEKMYDSNDWRARKTNQPFFVQIQLNGGKARAGAGPSPLVKRSLPSLTSPDAVKLPPYYPDDPIIRADWAAYLDACRFTDQQVGEIIKRLADDGLLQNTIVFFMTDHGISHARGKQFLYDEGMHVPLIVRGPGIEKGKVRSDLVEHIDLAATSLALASIGVPKWMQAQDFLAKDYRSRDAVFAARDRCDETVEGIRAVRTDRFKYIRNFYPDRPHLQPNVYKDNKPILKRLRELNADGKLSGLPKELLFASSRPHEELYDLAADPYEIKNLAGSSEQRETLLKLRRRLDQWMEKVGDQGRKPESEKMYDSDMAVYLNEGGRAGGRVMETQANIDLMKRWAKEKPMKINP